MYLNSYQNMGEISDIFIVEAIIVHHLDLIIQEKTCCEKHNGLTVSICLTFRIHRLLPCNDWAQQSWQFGTIPPSTEFLQKQSLHCGFSWIFSWSRLFQRCLAIWGSFYHPFFLPCLLSQGLDQHHSLTLTILSPSASYPLQAFLSIIFCTFNSLLISASSRIQSDT